jgi:hypothetical protein
MSDLGYAARVVSHRHGDVVRFEALVPGSCLKPSTSCTRSTRAIAYRRWAVNHQIVGNLPLVGKLSCERTHQSGVASGRKQTKGIPPILTRHQSVHWRRESNEPRFAR